MMSHQNRYYIFVLGLLAIALGGCTVARDVPYLEEPDTTAVPAEDGQAVVGDGSGETDATRTQPGLKYNEFDLSTATTAGELKIQPGDQLRVSVWGYPELEHIAAVQPTGFVTLPLAGDVSAAGLTTDELRQRITGQLQPFTRPSSVSLRQGDELTMSVWEHDSLYYKATIEPAGTVTFPLVGTVMAEGRALEEIHKEVATRLRAHINYAEVTLLPNYMNRRVLQDFRVSVLSHKLQQRRVALIGAVAMQGLQPIHGSLRLADALAQAQLDDKIAALNSIVVIRNPQSKSPQYRRIRVRDYFDGLAPNQNIYLQHEDIVIIPKTAIAQVGDFVDVFFARTMPIFTWWSAGWGAVGAEDSRETIKLINKSLEEGLIDVSVN